jgi:hypothetical protein
LNAQGGLKFGHSNDDNIIEREIKADLPSGKQ